VVVIVAWLVVGLVLVYVELHTVGFFAIFGAAGAFAAAIVSAFSPEAYAVQGIVGGVVTVAGVAALRPFVSRSFAVRRGSGAGARGVHGGLVGQEAFTLDEVGRAHLVGHARLAGERWLAVSEDGAVIPPDTVVVVTAVEGTTLTVRVGHEQRRPQATDPAQDGRST
jgi:membrane protein implicated in regulation of membrane protease activity